MKQEPNIVDLIGIDEESIESIDPNDYVFVVDADGNLKTLMCPEDESVVHSDGVLKLMKLFGIGLHDTHTLH
jgi:hypothetical protein